MYRLWIFVLIIFALLGLGGCAYWQTTTEECTERMIDRGLDKHKSFVYCYRLYMGKDK